MFKNIFSNFALISFLLLLFFSCTEVPPVNNLILNRKTPSKQELFSQKSNKEKEEAFFASYEEHLSDYDSSIYFKKWSYDPKENNIICSDNEQAAILEAFNHKLGLGFKDFLAKENKKTLRFKAVSPFAKQENVGVYDSKKPLRLNGRLFSGVLVGTHIKTGQRLIEVRFYRGIRIGNFKIWTNLGRLYEKSFGRNNIIIYNEPNVRKPVIYLYPTTKQDIAVQLDFKGELIHSYPAYPLSTGWKVQAQPNGTLTDLQTGKEYGYLFWEGSSNYHYQAPTGFVVEGAATADFLDEKLAILGLNRTEATDFITYWLPELESSPYNLIHFSTTAYQKQAPLVITPQPETIIRVFMVYQPLAAPILIPTQQLEASQRQGFTVVEWGGKKEEHLSLLQ
ncbi:MAG: hypothetical protein ACRBFS_05010 [Aureispira sp.]